MNRNLLFRLASLALAAALVPACGGSSGGGGGGAPSVTPSSGNGSLDDGLSSWITPGGSPGRTIVARGGKGTSGQGGNGGSFYLNALNGSNNRILRTGTPVTTFTVPGGALDLGANPLTISTDTVLSIGPGYPVGYFPVIWGDDGATAATGLWVQAGVTLTLNPNYDNELGDGELDTVTFSTFNSMLIEGTIVTALKEASTTDRSNLWTVTGTTVYGASAVIDTSGLDSAGPGPGGAAGVQWLISWGAVVSRGSHVARGGDGPAGGAGALVQLESYTYAVYHTGSSDASGGTGSATTGGNAGGVNFFASSFAGGPPTGGSAAGGGIFNSGTVTARGGSGPTGGGNGGQIHITDYWVMDGPVVSSGSADSSGGDALVSGDGGEAEPIRVISAGGELRVTGTYTARGGNGAGGGVGGDGDWVLLDSNTGGNAQSQQAVGAGTYVGADLDMSGGDGAVGGNAGSTTFWVNPTYSGASVQPGKHPAWIVGYDSMDLSGGDGATSGGHAGEALFRTMAATTPGGTVWWGSIVNAVPVTARGGQGAAGNGGNGNRVWFLAESDNVNAVAGDWDRVFLNTAAMDLRGGDGTVLGGNGGEFRMQDQYRLENFGDVVTDGGDGGSAAGGFPGSIVLQSNGFSINQADLKADGGSSTADIGRRGGSIFVEGRSARTTGILSARGGAGTGNTGGNGGNIEIGSFDGDLSTISGTLGVQPGPGSPPGRVGIVTIDGVRAALVNGSLSY